MWREPTKSSSEKQKVSTGGSGSAQKETAAYAALRKVISAGNEEQRTALLSKMLDEHRSTEWKDVLLQVDKEESLVKSREEAQTYLSLWKMLSEDKVFPYRKMLRRWTHTVTQSVFFSHLLTLPPDIMHMHRSDITPVLEKFKETYEYSSEVRKMVWSGYNCEEVYALAAEMEADEGLLMLSGGIDAFPEIVCLGVAKYVPKYEKLFADLLACAAGGTERGRVVMKKLFERRPRQALHTLGKIYPGGVTLEECLNACLEGRMLPHILKEMEPLEFCLDLVLLAVSKEIIDLGVIVSLHSNEEFINNYVQHIMGRYGKGSAKGTNIYPLTVTVIISTYLAFDVISKALTKTTHSYLNKMKSLLIPEIRACLVKKTTLKQQASEFLHNVISGRTTNSDAVVYMTQISSNKNSYDIELFECVISEMGLKYSLLERLGQHEIMAMALFYGRVVKYEILPAKNIKKTLEAVFQFLREEPRTNKFKFGLKALETFCDVLEKYPFYCQEYSRMPQIYAANKSLYMYIRGHLAIQGISSKEETEEGSMLFQDFLLEVLGPVEARAGWTKQMNMLTSASVSAVVEHIQKESPGVSEEELAKYLIVKRMLKETNHLRTYVEFIAEYSSTLSVQVQGLFFQILREYAERHAVIDKAEKLASLRVIGTYLGMLTFGGGMPIRKKAFCVQEFVIESVNKKCVYSAIVFACKYVEECTKSKIIGKNSPYVRGILKILSEIHYLTEGSDLISLEIEICFSKIEVPIEDVLPGIAIQERRLGAKRKVSGLAKYIELDGIRNILAHISIMGIDFAVRDITYSIVDKVFNICTRASIEIVKRDFSREKEKGVDAFKSMVVGLSVQLACASTSGPIFSSAVNNITHFMKLAGMEGSISSDKINTLVEKNMGICMGLVGHITRSRVEQGLAAMAEELLEEMEEESKCLQDPVLAPAPPDAFKIDLYERAEYAKPEYIIAENILPVTVGEYHEICAYLSSINYKSKESGEPIGPFTGSTAQKKWEEMQKVLQEIEKSGEEEVKLKCAIELRESIHMILSFVHSGAYDMACLFFCQNIIGSIFMLNNEWARMECIKTVHKICRLSYNSMQEVSSWLIYAEDERKFNPAIIAQMLDKSIMNRTEYDIHLGETVTKNLQKVKFAVELLRKCLMSDVSIGTPFDFVCTIESVSKSAKGTTDERVKNLLKDIAKRIFLSKRDSEDKDLFESWTECLFYRVASKKKEENLEKIIKAVEEKTKTPGAHRDFIKASFSVCMEFFLRLRKECSPIKYLKAEALGRLLGLISKARPSVLAETLEILTEIFLDGVEVFYYQIQIILLRTLQVVLEYATTEQEEVVFEYLKRVRPTVLGVFVGGYIELLFSEYVIRNMFVRNPYKGIAILEWVYEAVGEMPSSSEKDCAVYACAVFALHLKKYAPHFYLHYSQLCLLIIPITQDTILLRNAWCFERHPSSMEVVLHNKEKIRNAEYFSVLQKITDVLQSKEFNASLLDADDETVSYVLVDSLTSQKEISKIYHEIILGLFSRPEHYSLKEHILGRLLEKTCAVPPRPFFVKKTLDSLLNNQLYVESLSEIVRKDKNILGKLIIHASTVLATESFK
ncbi:CCR4-NOT transcription complex subunit 1 [Nematocida sp. AWRm77]|nr:CCR4-NOT transcription complex subunit 1 [Nematocida sp. AWRm77]